MCRNPHWIIIGTNDKFDVAELASFQQLAKVLMKRTLGGRKQKIVNILETTVDQVKKTLL